MQNVSDWEAGEPADASTRRTSVLRERLHGPNRSMRTLDSHCMPFRTLAEDAAYEDTIKGSRFAGHAARVRSREEAAARLEALRSAHPDASHVCFGWRLGPDQRSSDDGEPGGTAGRPILEVILQRDLDEVLVAVVRWFGGTKLGAGGLARAYRGTAAKTLDRAGEKDVVDAVRVVVAVPFAHMDATLRHLGDDPRIHLGAPSFTPEGMQVEAMLPVDAADEVRAGILDRTRGEGKFIVRS